MDDGSFIRHGVPAIHPGCLALVVTLLLSCLPSAARTSADAKPPSSPTDGPASGITTKVDAADSDRCGSDVPSGDRPVPVFGDAIGRVDEGVSGPPDAPPVDARPTPAPLPPNALDGLPQDALVVYWGQNAAGGASGDKSKYEKALGEICAANPQYNAIVVGFISVINDPGNASGAPHISVSYHCDTPYDAANPRIWRCPAIEQDIISCQQMGKKVLISIGGARGSYSLPNDAEGERFAQLTWDMLLNGQGDIRPFGGAVFDGVDLDLEGGATAGYVAFVRKLRTLMKTDVQRRYLITAAPQCVFPDAFLGPRPGTVLGEVPTLLDYLFVQFYNNPCAVNGGGFRASLASWTKVGPKVLVGMPAAPGAALNGYVAPAALSAVTGVVKGSSNPVGVMLWDASYDQLSGVNGKVYSAAVRAVLP
jgi:chitinase